MGSDGKMSDDEGKSELLRKRESRTRKSEKKACSCFGLFGVSPVWLRRSQLGLLLDLGFERAAGLPNDVDKTKQ
jgi:hypothetical protein